MKFLVTMLSFLLLSFNVSAQTVVNTSEDGKKVDFVTAPEPEENLIDDKIYFFVHSMCTSCKDAFVYIYTEHPELKLPITDMKFHHNLELYKQCVQKFGISNKELRLPLICMGNHYLMGWDDSSEQRFEDALNAYMAETAPHPE